MDLGAGLVLETVKMIAEGDVRTEVQSSADQLKEAPKLNNENTRIDWSKPAGEIEAHIRGLDPYPAAWCYLVNGGEELKTKIFGVSWADCEHEHPAGKLIYDKKNIWVALENGLLEIKELQLPGKRKMKSIDLLNGFTFEADAKVV